VSISWIIFWQALLKQSNLSNNKAVFGKTYGITTKMAPKTQFLVVLAFLSN